MPNGDFIAENAVRSVKEGRQSSVGWLRQQRDFDVKAEKLELDPKIWLDAKTS